MIYAFVVMCLIGGALAGPTKPACPATTFVENFNMTKFRGNWYVAERTNPSNETDCNSVFYYDAYGMTHGCSSDRRRVSRRQSDIYGLPDDQHVYTATTFVYNPNDGSLGDAILATDYTSYTIFYWCKIGKGFSVQIMTRNRQPKDDVLPKAHKILEEKKLVDVKLFSVNQSDC